MARSAYISSTEWDRAACTYPMSYDLTINGKLGGDYWELSWQHSVLHGWKEENVEDEGWMMRFGDVASVA
jgi:hypothetical protein